MAARAHSHRNNTYPEPAPAPSAAAVLHSHLHNSRVVRSTTTRPTFSHSYKSLGEPLLDFRYEPKGLPNQPQSTNNKSATAPITTTVIESKDNNNRTNTAQQSSISKAAADMMAVDPIRDILALCTPRRADAAESTAAIKDRVRLSNQRILAVRSGTRFTDIDSVIDRQLVHINRRGISKNKSASAASTSSVNSNTAINTILDPTHTGAYSSSPDSIWYRLTDLIQQKSTQLRALASMGYFAPHLAQKDKKQILRQLNVQQNNNNINPNNPNNNNSLSLSAATDTANASLTLARSYADFDLAKKDLRFRLNESLLLLDDSLLRTELLSYKYHNFKPDYIIPDNDIQRMRGYSEKCKFNLIQQRNILFNLLQKIILFIQSKKFKILQENEENNSNNNNTNNTNNDNDNTDTSTNNNINNPQYVPSMIVIELIELLYELIDRHSLSINCKLQLGSIESFSIILESIGSNKLNNSTDIQLIIQYTAELFQLTITQYQQALKLANIELKSETDGTNNNNSNNHKSPTTASSPAASQTHSIINRYSTVLMDREAANQAVAASVRRNSLLQQSLHTHQLALLRQSSTSTLAQNQSQQPQLARKQSSTAFARTAR